MGITLSNSRFCKENRLLQAALSYCRKGLSVIPLKQKKALYAWQDYQQRLATVDEVTTWWAQHPDANVGIVTGKISGIIVLDVDGEPGIETIKRERLQIIPTLTVRTGGGGYHYIFRHPGGIVRNFTRKLPGIDLRGDGGYIVAPPSIHPSGNRYEWLIKESPAEAPDWLLTLITSENTSAGKASPNKWRELAFKVVAEGERNSSLTALAGHLLRRYVDPYLALELLLLWNQARCVPPLPVEEVQRTVDSVAKLEARRRGVSA